MKLGCARSAAAEWVSQHGRHVDGFLGAYYSGSVVGLPDDAELPESSDVDIIVVSTRNEVPPKPGKFLYRGALLEVTHLAWNALSSAEAVLASHHLAHSLRTDTIIADPTGRLRKLQACISLHFAERRWVRRRCENVLVRIEDGLGSIDPCAPFYDQVTAWLFPTGITTHVLLLAALRNPTVRRRYDAVRETLRDYDLPYYYPELLALLGCAHLPARRVGEHLDALAETFDAAVAVAKTPFPFSSDITALARPITVEGSRQLIRDGHHHEAVFWIVATFARCHKILAADAPPQVQRAHLPAFRKVMADLGIANTGDLLRRAQEGIGFLPRLWEMAEVVLVKNPEIVD